MYKLDRRGSGYSLVLVLGELSRQSLVLVERTSKELVGIGWWMKEWTLRVQRGDQEVDWGIPEALLWMRAMHIVDSGSLDYGFSERSSWLFRGSAYL